MIDNEFTGDAVVSRTWEGDHPCYLTVQHENGYDLIDLDEHGWIAANQHLFRAAGLWTLVRKEPRERLLTLLVRDGEQAYYVSHVSMIWAGPDRGHVKVTAYGIGKKRVDGNEDNLWFIQPDIVMVGPADDCDSLATTMVRVGLPQPLLLE